MSGLNGKEYVLIKQFHGLPSNENFQVKEYEVPALKDGGMIILSTTTAL